MLYTFLQTNINSYNAKKVFPGSSKGREGKGYDWLIKFSETELGAEGNFSYVFLETKKEEEGQGCIPYVTEKGPNLLFSALFIRTKRKQIGT